MPQTARVCHAYGSRNIKKSAKARSRVINEADRVRHGLVDFELQNIIYHHGDVVQIAENIGDAPVDDVRRNRLVNLAQGIEQGFVHGLVKRINATVETFQRITGIICGGGRACACEHGIRQ